MSSRETEDARYWTLVWVVVGFGAFLQLWQYLANRSLWADEAAFTLNIIGRSFKGLLGQLDFQQVSPIGFLFIEKSAVTLFGNNEYAIRLWPLLAGLLGLILFPFVARRCCGSRASLIAVALFAVFDRIIYYSSEVKLYSSDVAVTLAIFLVVLSMERDGFWKRKLLLLGVIGAVSIWISYVSLFAFTAALIVMAVLIRKRKSGESLAWFTLVCVMWLVSVALCYSLSLPQLAGRQFLLDELKFSLAPFPFSSLANLQWYFKIFPALMWRPGGFSFPRLALFVAFIGALSMARDKKYTKIILLLSPVLFAFVASGFKRYPIFERFMLFAVPSALLLIAEGIDVFMRSADRLVKIWGVTLLCLLIMNPLRVSMRSFFQPRSSSCGPAEMRTVLEHVKSRREPGDVIYVHYNGMLACRYYTYDEDIALIEGNKISNSSQECIDEIESLRGSPGVWFIFTRAYPRRIGIDEERFFIDYLNKIGELRYSYKIFGGSAYLYDLSIR